MKSKAAIGNHPIHPALVAVPVGAFVVALIGDIATSAVNAQFWYSFALYSMGTGILSALLTAVFGFVDYVFVSMTPQARTLATRHLVLNLTAVVLYVISFFLRIDNAAFQTSRWAGVSYHLRGRMVVEGRGYSCGTPGSIDCRVIMGYGLC